MNKYLYRILILMSLFYIHSIYAQNFEIKLEGINQSSLLSQIQQKIKTIDIDENDDIERYKSLFQDSIDNVLRAEGYYNTTYHFDFMNTSTKTVLIIQLKLNNPVKINETDVKIIGDGEKDKDFIEILNTLPKKGEILNHAKYDLFKQLLEKLSQNKGYFNSQFLVHRLEIIPSESIANWRLTYDTATRYRYGNIIFQGSQIREDYLRNILKITTNDYYSTNDISTLTSDFSNSKWFNSVLVDPVIKRETKTVDLNILLNPHKKNDIELGLGYISNVGVRFQLNWKQAWLNARGDNIELNSYLTPPEQKVEWGYKIPVKQHPLDYFYEFSAGLEKETQNDTSSKAITSSISRYWNRKNGWAFSLGGKFRYDNFAQGGDTFKTFIWYPSFSLNRIRTDGKQFIHWGDSQKLTLNWGSRSLGSDISFYSIKFYSAWIRTYLSNHRIYLRTELGYLHSKKFEKIPPSLRFFAGGDKSVRGFKYKTISPVNYEGKLIGGTYLATSTAEYQYQLYHNWWGAIFYDLGLASNQLKRDQLNTGCGVGVRWTSPIGAIKIDLALPLHAPTNKKGIQFYIGLGNEL